MKKILRFASALLCGAMLLCSLSVTAFAENDDEVYDFDPNTDKIYSEAVYMVNTEMWCTRRTRARKCTLLQPQK